MSVIAGFLSDNPDFDSLSECRAMLRALAAFGLHASNAACAGNAAFGRNLFKSLPEDDRDRQPLVGGGGRWLFVGDVRIDNRAELASSLGIAPDNLLRMADSALLLAAWERLEFGALDAAEGDFAFAVHDQADRSLTLVRSPLSAKPLFYHKGRCFTAFASMPVGLHALSAVPKQLDFDHAAAMVGQFSALGSSTIFAGIRQVPHSHLIRLSEGCEEVRRTWSPERRLRHGQSLANAGEELREALERSVAARLRRHGGLVASQLSSGRDSSAVTVAAADILEAGGESLLAVTGSTALGFAGPTRPGTIADESVLAAQIASAHDNVHHLVARPPRQHWMPQLRRFHAAHWGPMPNPSQLPWWTMVNEDAARCNATVMLSAGAGNFTISAGGPDHIRDLLIENGLESLLATMVRLAGGSIARWRNLTSTACGPVIPEGVYRMALRLAGRWDPQNLSVSLLRQPHRAAAEDQLRGEFGDPRPARSAFDYRRKLLMARDHPEKMSIATWGLDQRDPTADRRLVELCFSIPADQLVSGQSARPLYAAAFRGRVPESVIRGEPRGYQGADWFEHFRRDEIALAFERFRRNEHLGELIDFGELDRLLAAWPTSGWETRSVLEQYRGSLLATLAVADFIDLHFPG